MSSVRKYEVGDKIITLDKGMLDFMRGQVGTITDQEAKGSLLHVIFDPPLVDRNGQEHKWVLLFNGAVKPYVEE